jgi:hypothetical protein
MRNIRTCSHIKVNGVKCGSPALRHQTLCYFHYQWDRRARRRVRLGGPVGTNKNTGIDFPILEGPESIMLALMEVQHALLDARIDRLTAHTLLYSLQLAMQLKISTFTGLSSRLQSVSTCPELESDLDLDRARGLRPAKEVCSTCPDTDSCVESEHCPSMGAPAPRRPRDPMDQPLVVPITGMNLDTPTTAPDFCHAERSEASLSTPPLSTSTVVRSSGLPISDPLVAFPPSSRPESPSDGVEGPAFTPMTTDLDTATTLPRESSPARECGVMIAKIEASRANARRQIRTHLPARTTRLVTSVNAKTPDSRPGLLSRSVSLDHALKGVASHEPSLRDDRLCGWPIAALYLAA